LGGIPIDRKGTSNKVESIATLFDEHDRLNLAITPEGTRSLSPVWKKGFYYIALKADVPILMTSLDYGKKEGRLGPIFKPTGDFDQDFEKLETFYRGIKAKYPDKFNLS
jgi:1-acyl-sn-glycerol-3-phosphate acyltransferase